MAGAGPLHIFRGILFCALLYPQSYATGSNLELPARGVGASSGGAASPSRNATRGGRIADAAHLPRTSGPSGTRDPDGCNKAVKGLGCYFISDVRGSSRKVRRRTSSEHAGLRSLRSLGGVRGQVMGRRRRRGTFGAAAAAAAAAAGPASSYVEAAGVADDVASDRRCNKCDWTQGRWVEDQDLPIYTGLTCKRVRGQSCATGGRDLSYQKWRWQPWGCELQAVSPEGLGRALGGKLVVIAGDSVARNMASSLICTLNAAAPGLKKFKEVVQGVPLKGVLHPSFNIRVVTFFSNTLTNSSRAPDGYKALRVDLDVVDPDFAQVLPLADVILFQATMWWRNPWNQLYFQGKRVSWSILDAYKASLETLEGHLKEAKYRGQAYIVSASPTHYDLPPDLKLANGTCSNVKVPLTSKEVAYVEAKQAFTGPLLQIQRDVAYAPDSIIDLVDITQLSYYRADSHIGALGHSEGHIDCLHWCESGVTDTWVEILYNKLTC